MILLRDVRQGWGWALAWLGVFWAIDGLAQSYVRFGIRADHALPGENLALWYLNRLGAFLPVTVAVLLMIFPTGRFLEGRWGRACQAGLALMVARGPGRRRRPDRLRPRRTWPSRPACDLDAFTLPLPAGPRGPGGPRGRRASRSAACCCPWPPWSSATAGPGGWSATGCAGCSGR